MGKRAGHDGLQLLLGGKKKNIQHALVSSAESTQETS